MPWRRIDDSLWTDPVIRGLSANAKYVFLYLLTNPHAHFTGLYFCPVQVVAIETGLSELEVLEALDALEHAGRIRIDAERELVWVVNMGRYQATAARPDLIRKGVAKHLGTLHQSPLIAEFIKAYPSLAQGLAKTCRTLGQGLLLEGLSNPSGPVPGNCIPTTSSTLTVIPDKVQSCSNDGSSLEAVDAPGAADRVSRCGKYAPWSKDDLEGRLRGLAAIHEPGLEVVLLFIQEARYSLDSLPSPGALESFLAQQRPRAERLLELAGGDVRRVRKAMRVMQAHPFFGPRWTLDLLCRRWADVPRIAAELKDNGKGRQHRDGAGDGPALVQPPPVDDVLAQMYGKAKPPRRRKAAADNGKETDDGKQA